MTRDAEAAAALLHAACPAPPPAHERVLLAHGGGGRLMHALIDDVFRAAFHNPLLDAGHDGAQFDFPAGRLAFTTDAHVVRPLEFPGGDIGRLAVCGTVNDLAMCGAVPLHLSAGFILEEGLPVETLRRIVASMAHAATEAGVQIVTGDTKVVERGRADGLYVTTAGIGVVPPGVDIAPGRVRAGDAVLLSGDVGRHGIAVMAERESLSFEPPVESDCAPLHAAVAALLAAGIHVHMLRDLTRGGLAAALVEIAEATGLTLRVEEAAIPIVEPVRAACELLGFDPLHVANEGRFVAFVPEAQAARALAALAAIPVSTGARRIGAVSAEEAGLVTLRTLVGTERLVDMPSGEQLPRIC